MVNDEEELLKEEGPGGEGRGRGQQAIVRRGRRRGDKSWANVKWAYRRRSALPVIYAMLPNQVDFSESTTPVLRGFEVNY